MQQHRHHRRATAYLVVLGTTMLVTVIGLSALLAVRIQQRSARLEGDFAEARFLARSAIEMGGLWISQDEEWRASRGGGVWADHQALGDGEFSLAVTDPDDGDLTDSETDPVTLTGIGYKNNSRYKLQVTLVSETRALTCLEVALSTAGNLAMDDATANCNQIISSNGSVTGVAASLINGNVEAVGAVTGVAVSGSTTTPIPERTMPDTSTVYDDYIAEGTSIDINTIPDDHGVYTISGVVLSPMSNPFGTRVTNPRGIYIIDALGSRLKISDSRIVGTLVILNGSPMCSYVQGPVNWEPAVSNYPALLVQGPLCLYMDSGILDEKDTGTSLNPEGTPYGDPGNWDDDTGDTYPSIINGLVYAESRFDVASGPVVDGVVVSGGIANLTPFTVLDLTFERTYLDNPPPGFTAPPQMIVSSGTWKPVVD